jgi:hypothetical protein
MSRYRPPERPHPATDSEIQQAMVTSASEFTVPADDHFKPQLEPAQVYAINSDPKLSPEERDRRLQMLAGLSIHSQWGDWSIEQTQILADWVARLDYEQARRKVEEDKHKAEEQEKALLWKIARWSLPTIFGAALIAIVQLLMKRWLGP